MICEVDSVKPRGGKCYMESYWKPTFKTFEKSAINQRGK